MSIINYEYLGKFAPGVYYPVFDPTGTSPENLITSEAHTVNSETELNYHVIVPLFAPFFAESLKIVYNPFNSENIRTLTEGIDYTLSYQFIGATRGCAKPVYGAIDLVNKSLAGTFTLVYQTIGGNWCIDISKINEILTNNIQNPRITSWEQIVELPELFPVVDHQWHLADLVGASDLVKAIDELSGIIAKDNSVADLESLRLILENKLLELETKTHNYYTSTVTALANINTFLIKEQISINDLINEFSAFNEHISNVINDIWEYYNALNKKIDITANNLREEQASNLTILNNRINELKNSIANIEATNLTALASINTSLFKHELDIVNLNNELHKLTISSKNNTDNLNSNLNVLKDNIYYKLDDINNFLINSINNGDNKLRIDMLNMNAVMLKAITDSNNNMVNMYK